MGCEVLAASFKNSQQIMELAAYGVSAATAAPSVIDVFLKNAAIDNSVNDFIHDFEELMHPGCTMAEVPEYQR